MARHRLKLTTVCRKADLNYHSVRVNLPKFEVSEERINKLEEAALDLAKENVFEEA